MNNKRKYKNVKILLVNLLLIISLVLTGCGNSSKQDKSVQTETKSTETSQFDSSSTVHFINTGNSDSILIENNGEFALIDGGNTDDDNLIKNYLKKENVKTLKYLIVTHPHADHIGALDTVVKNFEVTNIFIGSGKSKTKTYNSFLDSAKKKNISPAIPTDGQTIVLGKGTLALYNGKGIDGKNLNNYSIVTKYTNGKDSFLLMGDAEKDVESKYKSVLGTADVLKVGHHGSSSSSSPDFVKSVNPKFIVILTGENNYGHPHKETVDLFKNLKIPVYRSDESGDIIFKSTGTGVNTDAKVGDYKNNSSNETKPDKDDE